MPDKDGYAEVEITPAMLAAGVDELRLSFSQDGSIDEYPDVVRDIFTAMMRAVAS